jgi:hypothetical protein
MYENRTLKPVEIVLRSGAGNEGKGYRVHWGMEI